MAAVNAAINGLTALAEVENGIVAEDRGLAAAVRASAAEVAGVGAGRCMLVPDAAQATVAVATATGGNRSSMLRDLEPGTRSEVNPIHGEVVARARVMGRDVPRCATLAAIIRAREQTAAAKGRGGWPQGRANDRSGSYPYQPSGGARAASLSS